jgi:hypothetical protein
MAFGFTKISRGLQAVLGVATTIVGILSDPSVYGFLPHKVAIAVGIGGAIVAGLSHPPSTPISGNAISPKVADKLGVAPPTPRPPDTF